MTPASESWICRIAASISLTSRHTTAAPMIFPPSRTGTHASSASTSAGFAPPLAAACP